MIVRGARNADAAGFAKRLQACGDIDAVAENIIAVDDDVADIDADPEWIGLASEPPASCFRSCL